MPKWQIGTQFDSGGFAVIRRVIREEDGEEFAGKFLDRRWCRDAAALARFRKEVALQQILQHPNVMPIIATRLKGPKPWFVMPMAAQSLQKEIDAGMTETRAEEVFGKILDAMRYAHGHQILHRDLKPQNIMIDRAGEPLVSDFGLGKNLASDSTALTTTTVQVGSFVYAAPEQLRDLRATDQRTDIFALGKVLQAMVTGQLPVDHDDPKVPRRHRHFIVRCTEMDPARRYQTIEDVILAFDQVRSGVETPEVPREEFARIVAEWQALPEGDDLAALDNLHAFLERHSENGGLYRDVIPELPVDLIEQYAGQRPREFRGMLIDYDGHLGGYLDFDYCDDVATFYERVFGYTDDVVVKRTVLRRLLALGRSHNRFFVGQTAARVLARMRDESEVLMATEAIRDQPEDAAWCEGWAKDLAVAESVRAALRRATTAVAS